MVCKASNDRVYSFAVSRANRKAADIAGYAQRLKQCIDGSLVTDFIVVSCISEVLNACDRSSMMIETRVKVGRRMWLLTCMD